MEIRTMTKEQRLLYLCYRIHRLEINYPPIIEWDKYNRATWMLWRVLDNNVSDEEWALFFEDNKMRKYIKELEK